MENSGSGFPVPLRAGDLGTDNAGEPRGKRGERDEIVLQDMQL